MWIIPKGGQPAPAGIFQSESDGTALHVQRAPVDVQSLAAVAQLRPAVHLSEPLQTPYSPG